VIHVEGVSTAGRLSEPGRYKWWTTGDYGVYASLRLFIGCWAGVWTGPSHPGPCIRPTTWGRTRGTVRLSRAPIRIYINLHDGPTHSAILSRCLVAP